ncbi:MAG: response regulator transcription factor [Planctomycetota bacterium]
MAGPTQTITICIVGGFRIYHHACREFLKENGIIIGEDFENEQALADYLDDHHDLDCDAILLIVRNGPFTTFHRIKNILATAGHPIPLAILSEQAGREEVYAALRSGAKAYVHVDAEPAELVQAIRQVARNKTYLGPAAAEMLVNDVSATSDTPRGTRLPSVHLSHQLLWEGLSSKEIARRLHISPKTVENHRYAIYRKCQIDSFVELMRYALKQGIVSL